MTEKYDGPTTIFDNVTYNPGAGEGINTVNAGLLVLENVRITAT